MNDYFNINLTDSEIGQISALGLAHLGDAVFELMVRTYLCCHGGVTSKGLHRASVSLVSAPAQAKLFNKFSPILTEHELAVFKRGRNTHVNSVPKNASLDEYHTATGFETLFGYLYLSGQKDRLNELFDIAMKPEEEQ